jgi:chromosome segregation ATPase
MKNEEKILTILEAIQEQIAEMHEQIDSIQAEQTQMRGQISIMQGDVINAKSEISDMHGSLIKANSEIKRVSGTAAVTHRAINAMQEEITGVRHSVAVIEVEHGQKLGALFDNMVMTGDFLSEFRQLRETVDKLDFGKEVLELLEKVGYTV